ncbi:hypothetical protein [Embleya sp. MST-111070]|uniref:hypothetical protein n=1 Tax=Embleya sp. MST-111070 TaxID=3398231 RepID=UPI003F736903
MSIRRAALAEDNPQRCAQWQEQLRRVHANIARTDPLVRRLPATAHVYQIQSAVRAARYWCLFGVALVSVGSVAFLTVTGDG